MWNLHIITFRFITKHTRRSWKRRKHAFEYILYVNVLSFWSCEYMFFKKNIRFNYNYCIDKSSLLVYNLANLRGTVSSLAKNSENSYLAVLPKTIVNYFSSSNMSLYRYWLKPVNTLLVFSSFYRNSPTDVVFKTCLTSPSFIYTTTTMYPDTGELYTLGNDSLESLFTQLLINNYYQLIIEIYKINTLITLASMFNND